MLDFRPSDEIEGGWELSLANNVPFLATQTLLKLKVSTEGTHRINVYYGSVEREWDGRVFRGVAETFVAFDPRQLRLNDPIGSQLSVLDALERGVRKVPPPHGPPEEVLRQIRQTLIDANFEGEYQFPWTESIPDSAGVIRARIFFRSFFDHVAVFLRLRRGRKRLDLKVFETWPAPWLVVNSLRGFRVDANSLAFSIGHPKTLLGKTLFGRKFFDMSTACREFRIADVDSAKVISFVASLESLRKAFNEG